jgi:hypothetical protein
VSVQRRFLGRLVGLETGVDRIGLRQILAVDAALRERGGAVQQQ